KLLTEMFPIGTTIIDWTATDAAGNKSTCTQTITVTQGKLLVNYSFTGATGYPFPANETATGITSSVTSTEVFGIQNPGAQTGSLAFKTNAETNPGLSMENSLQPGPKYFEFTVGGAELVKYGDFKVYMQGRRLPDGATGLQLSYSTDGVNFTDNGTLDLPQQNQYYQAVFNWAGISSINFKSNLYIRVTPIGATPGTNALRVVIDNFQLLATQGGDIECTTLKPDLTPRINLNPNNIIGRSSMEVTVQVNEIRDVNTDGSDIVMYVDKNNMWSNFQFDPARTINQAGQSVQNSLFTIDAVSNPDFYIITAKNLIIRNELRRLVFTVTVDPGQTKGEAPVNIFLLPGSGGEDRFDNNINFTYKVFSF
ncbi:MAG TPA: HYR domain-containing protein, partial [Phnomibacter sp.]|nr:HYR domain-containing protein [Phnomibacter sp.]